MKRNDEKEKILKNELHHKASCDCGPDCHCGCQEGKECICGHQDSKCNCCCHKSCGKILAVILIFLAGMGFNELLHGSFRCPVKRHAPIIGNPMMYPVMKPAFTDGNGNTIIFINTDDNKQPCPCAKMHKHKHHHQFNNHNMMGNVMPETDNVPTSEEK